MSRGALALGFTRPVGGIARRAKFFRVAAAGRAALAPETSTSARRYQAETRG